MKTNSKPLFTALLVAIALAGNAYAAETNKIEKIVLSSISDTPDPFSPQVAGNLAISARFDCLPTDGGAANGNTGKEFFIRMTSYVSNTNNAVVWNKVTDYPIAFNGHAAPETFSCTEQWSGMSNGEIVPDGTYNYTVSGTLVRIDILGNGEPKEHIVGTSETLSGTVLVDSTSPVISNLQPNTEFTNNNSPIFTASFHDATSGINLDSLIVTLKVNGVVIDITTTKTATGVTCTPVNPLPDGDVNWSISIADNAGNISEASVNFMLDTISPIITNLTPEEEAVVDVPHPVLSASFSDERSGVDLASILITLSGADITDSANISAVGFSYTPPENLTEGEHVLVVLIADKAGNTVSASSTFKVSLLPPDPSEVAPEVDQTVVTDIHSATSFLYTGDNPIQTGVIEGVIELERVAILRGRVLAKDNSPLTGVKVSILNHPEFGQTLSREDGMFDMAINGGGYLVVQYEKEGYFFIQRKVMIPWRDYAWAPDVILIQMSAKATPVDLNQEGYQVARGEVVVDDDGSRQATLLVRPGTTASILHHDGSTEVVENINIRFTEYSVGPNGLESMPAELPPTSFYTHCFEVRADESIAKIAGKDLLLSQSLPLYFENYRGFPVGTVEPLAYYDNDSAVWVPENDGIVLKVLSIVEGKAELDLNGDGLANDTALLEQLNITDDELVEIAKLYSAGQTLIRILIPHFSTYDCNKPAGTNANEDDMPNEGAESSSSENNDDCGKEESDCEKKDPACDGGDKECGSIIDTRHQTLGESLSITGTNRTLNYISNRVPGGIGNNSITIPITNDTVPEEVTSILLTIQVAGQRHSFSYEPQPNITQLFAWDGKNAYGQRVQGEVTARIDISYSCKAYYLLLPNLAKNFGVPYGTLSDVEAPLGVQIKRAQEVTVGAYSSSGTGLGGWLIDNHHAYDMENGVLYLGTGEHKDTLGTTDTVIENFAGYLGQMTDRAQDAWRTWNPNWQPSGLATSPDGSLYVSDKMHGRVLRITPEGTTQVIATDFTAPMGLAIADDGSIFVADYSEHAVKRIAPDGAVTIIAGGNGQGYSGDEALATSSQLSTPFDVEVGIGGDIYISDSSNNVIRRISPDGLIYTHVGTGGRGYSGDGEQAINAQLNAPLGIAMDSVGRLYIADYGNHCIRMISPMGDIYTFAGTGKSGDGDDGGLATETQINAPIDVNIGADGSIYFAHSYKEDEFPDKRGSIRRVAANGYIYTVAGLTPDLNPTSSVVTSPSSAVIWDRPGVIATAPNGDIYIAEYFPDRIRKVTTSMPKSKYGGNIHIDAENGRAETYVFSPKGRHLATLDAVSSEPRYEFFYTGAGYLDHITDGDGNTTTIERDLDSNPVAIVAPFGQRTILAINEDGFLASITNPADETYNLGYQEGGLLTRFEKPTGTASVFEYDNKGRLTRDTDADGVYTAIDRVDTEDGYTITVNKPLTEPTVNTYAKDGRKLSRADNTGIVKYGISTSGRRDTVTDKLGYTRKYIRNAGGRVIKVLNPYAEGEPEPTTGVQYEYNEDGYRTKITDENGIVTSYTYEADRVKSMTRAGATTSYVYDSMGRKIKQTDAINAFTEWHYDERGLLVEVSGSAANGGGCNSCGSASGASSQLGVYEYDTLGRLEIYTDLEGHSTQYVYDDADRVTKIIDARNYETIITYNVDGTRKSVEDANGNVTSYVYTDAGRTLSVTNAENEAVSYTYDAAGRAYKTTAPDGGITETVFDTAGRVKETKDALNRITKYEYNADSSISRIINPMDVITDYVYNKDGQLIKTIADVGGLEATSQTEYDVGGRMKKSIDPLGHETKYTYNPQGYVETVTSHLGVETKYLYDALGRSTSVSVGGRTNTTTYNNAGWVTQTSNGHTVTDFEYDEVGNRTKVTVSGRAPVYYFYDATNNLIRTEQTGSDGTYIMTERDIDPVGNVLTSKDAEGKITRYVYNTVNRLDNVTNPANEVTRFEYDANGRRTKTILPNGQELVSSYDVAGQLTYTDGGPEGRNDFIYDDLGRNTEVKDANNRIRITNYDALSRVTSQLNEMGQPVSYGYDIAGRRTSLTDANGNTTSYNYNEDNQLVKMTYPEVVGEPANVEEYEYDTAGQLISKLTPNGDEIGYGYNAAGQLASVTFGNRTVAYSRDLAGAVTSIGGSGDVTTMSYNYNDLGRVTSVTDSALNKTINYGYNLNGMRTSLNLDATNIAYSYDNANRLKTVTKDTDAPAVYDYDDIGRRDSLTLPNGVVTNYGYSANSRLLNLTTANTAETLASFDYTVDPTGNRDKIVYADGSSSNYTYDGAYRLLSETRKKADGELEYLVIFTYDAVGNRMSKSSINAVQYSATSDTQGLWHFEEPVADGAVTIKDASGNDNNLVGSSGVTSTDGRFGKAINFEGGYLTTDDAATLELYDENFTLEAWVKLDSLSGTQVIVQKWDEVNDQRSYRLSLMDGIPQLELTTDGTSANVFVVSGTEVIGAETWTHIAAILDGENIKLLVDKVEVTTGTFAGSVFDGAADVIVGYGVDGVVDELRYANADKSNTLTQVSTIYTYNERNQLVTEITGSTTKIYSYDKNGNNIGIVESINGEAITTESMTYDELNRMLSYTGPRGTENFTYRGSSWHRVSADGKSFLYDGDNVLADIEAEAVSVTYVTLGLDSNMSMTTNGNTYYYSQDGLTSVRTLTDATGTMVNNYDYLPFGKAYSEKTTTTVDQRYTYTGREKNAVTPSMYYRNRNYSTNIGRFNRRDPIGYAGGINLYSYVSNHPISYSDPWGLAKVVITVRKPKKTITLKNPTLKELHEKLKKLEKCGSMIDSLWIYGHGTSDCIMVNDSTDKWFGKIGSFQPNNDAVILTAENGKIELSGHHTAPNPYTGQDGVEVDLDSTVDITNTIKAITDNKSEIYFNGCNTAQSAKYLWPSKTSITKETSKILPDVPVTGNVGYVLGVGVGTVGDSETYLDGKHL